MEITASLFAFILLIVPGIAAVQVFFTAQRLSVVYSDTAFEKTIAAVLVAPVFHGASLGLLVAIQNIFWWNLPNDYVFRLVTGAYANVSGFFFVDGRGFGMSDAAWFLSYFVFSIATASLLSFIVTKLSIHQGGAPGFRQGIYKIVNHFLKTGVVASVITELSSNGEYLLLYKGTVDKVAFTKNGDIRLIYLAEPSRSKLKLGHSTPNAGAGDRKAETSREFFDEHLIGESMQIKVEDLASQGDVSFPEDLDVFVQGLNEGLFTGRLLIDGAHVKNIYFHRGLTPSQPLKEKIVRALPFLFPDSRLRLGASTYTYSEVSEGPSDSRSSAPVLRH